MIRYHLSNEALSALADKKLLSVIRYEFNDEMLEHIKETCHLFPKNQIYLNLIKGYTPYVQFENEEEIFQFTLKYGPVTKMSSNEECLFR